MHEAAGRSSRAQRSRLERAELAFGMKGGIPVTGDFNGDGVTEIGVFIDGEWFIDLNGNGVWDEGDLWAKLGDARRPAGHRRLGRRRQRPTSASSARPGCDDPVPWRASRACPTPTTRRQRRVKNMPPDPSDAPRRLRTLKRTAQGKVRADLIDHVFHYGTPGDCPDGRRLERRRHRARSASSATAAGTSTSTATAAGPTATSTSSTSARRATCRSSATSTATASTKSASTATAPGTSTPTATGVSTATTRCSNWAARATSRWWATGTATARRSGVFHDPGPTVRTVPRIDRAEPNTAQIRNRAGLFQLRDLGLGGGHFLLQPRDLVRIVHLLAARRRVVVAASAIADEARPSSSWLFCPSVSTGSFPGCRLPVPFAAPVLAAHTPEISLVDVTLQRANDRQRLERFGLEALGHEPAAECSLTSVDFARQVNEALGQIGSRRQLTAEGRRPASRRLGFKSNHWEMACVAPVRLHLRPARRAVARPRSSELRPSRCPPGPAKPTLAVAALPSKSNTVGYPEARSA